MPRVGTLLGTGGRPNARVQIIRKGKNATRIKHPTNNGRSWSVDEDTVDTALILDDGGTLWDQHSHNPGHATYLGLSGDPVGRLSIQRVYKHVVKARIYQGDHQWSDVQDFMAKDVRFDGGAAAGWNPPAYLDDAPVTGNDADSGADSGDQGETVTSDVDGQQGRRDTPRGQRVSYIRVSTAEQNLARQREMIGPVDKEFQDKISARSRADRQGLEACLDYLREDDQLVVASIDRLARSLVDLQALIDQITDKGANVHFLKEGLTFSNQESAPREKFMLGILGSFAEFERSIIKERQAEGIALAKRPAGTKAVKRRLPQTRSRKPVGEQRTVSPRWLSLKTSASAGPPSPERWPTANRP